MAYYSVLAVTPTNEEWIPGYISPVNAIIAKHGGKYLARTVNHERVEGEGGDAALRASRKELIERAKTNKLSVPEMTGGTFTISNLGLSRVQYFTPILNTPQLAILGIGQTIETAHRAHDGSTIWKPMMGLSLTFDHRAIDGAPAAQFLSDLCETIETFE